MTDKALREAAAINDVMKVASLLKAGANPYAVDEKGRTAFNCAASNGLDALALMTEEAFRDTQQPAGQRKWPDYSINTPSGYYGSTLITYAAKVLPVDVIKEMIWAGADITIINGSGWTLLHCAAVMPGRLEVLKELVRAFKDQGHAAFIEAKTTHVYETTYGTHKVVFGENLTALDLCKTRLQQDPESPKEFNDYVHYLSQVTG